MPSQPTAIGASSVEQNERYDIITDEEWYILVKVYGASCYFDDHGFGDAHSGWVLARLMRVHVCTRVFEEKSERA